MAYKFATLEQIAQAVQDFDRFIICGHINPDADCVGSQLAVSLALDKLNKESVCLIANEGSVDKGLRFLDKTKDFVNANEYLDSKYFKDFSRNKFCFVCVDVQANYRIGSAAQSIKEKSAYSLIIDHHQREEPNADLTFVDDKAASNSLLIWDFCKILGIKIDSNIAYACYTGLCGDTNGFTNTNTDVRAFDGATQMIKAGVDAGIVAKNLFQTRSLASLELEKMILDRLYVDKQNRFALSCLTPEDFAKYQASKQDADHMIDLLRTMDCVDFVCVLRQINDGEKIHGSLRSKTSADVSTIASQYLGGGHKAAAGFTMDETNMQKALEDVKQKMRDLSQQQ